MIESNGSGPLAAQIVCAYLDDDRATFHHLLAHACEEFDTAHVLCSLVAAVAALIKVSESFGLSPDELRSSIIEGLKEDL